MRPPSMIASPFVAPNIPQSPRFAGARQVAPPRFGSATGFAQTAPSMAGHKIGGFLKAFDFKELGAAHLTQIKLIYGLCILSRIYNASKRSKNEVREVATRDTLGFAFWFFATSMIQRLFLKTMAPKEYRDALIRKATNPVAANTFKDALNLGWQDKIRYLNWRLNPLSRWAIPSTRQVTDQMKQALGSLERAGHGQGSAAYLKLENYYKGLYKWRNLATGLGTLITIALLGIGINMYNVYLTRKKVAEGQVGR